MVERTDRGFESQTCTYRLFRLFIQKGGVLNFFPFSLLHFTSRV